MLVGREIELGVLNSHFEKMLGGNGAVLFLTGEAGLGKTTLVHSWVSSLAGISDFGLPRSLRGSRISEKKDFLYSPKSEIPATSGAGRNPKFADGEQPPLFLESACSIPIGNVDVGHLEALQPWADVIAQLDAATLKANSSASDRKPINFKKLIHDAAPAWAWAIPFVGDLAHAALETSRLVKEQRGVLDANPSAQNQQQVFQQYVNLLTRISQETPLVIFLDDLHWADTSSCNLLFYLSREISDKRILVIGTYRQDDASQASEGKGHPIVTIKNEILRYKTGDEVTLTYLSRNAIRLYLTRVFPAYTINDNFERWLEKISDGNSLFMTQFVLTLREDGHLNDDGAFVGSYETISIPKSAFAVVEERTRRLGEATRKLLMYATAEGEEFTTYVLERLAKRDPLELLEDLQKATVMGFIVQRGTGRLYANRTTGIFGFSHALFHKALYDALLDMQKAHLHQVCFEILKAEWDRLADTSKRATPLATKLLMHAKKCGEWEAIADVALEAARDCWRTFNEDEARAMTSEVMAACDSARGLHRQRAEALFLNGQINALRGRYPGAIEDYRSAQLIFQSERAADREVDARNGIASSYYYTSSNDASLEESTRALSAAQAGDYRAGEAAALLNIGLVYSSRGAFDEALVNNEKSLSIFASIGNRFGEACALRNMAVVLANRGSYHEALAANEKSLAIFKAISNLPGEASVLVNMGYAYSMLGKLDEALAHCEKSLELFAVIGNRIGEASALGNIGVMLNGQALHEEAQKYHQRSHAIFASIGNRQGEATALMNLGITCSDRGKFEEALAYYGRSLVIFGEIGIRPGEANVHGNIGNVHAERGDIENAITHYQQSLAISIETGNRWSEARARISVGSMFTKKASFDEARNHLEQGVALATEIGAQPVVAEGIASLGLLCELESESVVDSSQQLLRSEARRYLEQAVEIFSGLRLPNEVEKWTGHLRRMTAE